jgi:sulfite reductase alpha subunit
MKVDQDEVKAFVEKKGRQYVIDNVITRCPTQALSLNDDNSMTVNNRDCVRCMHCLNVMPKALHPGDDKGVTILIGGKRTLKIGDLMGTVVVPFKKLETEEDYEEMVELAETIIDFWAENGLEHERCGEMIERIGLANFLDGIGVEPDPNMLAHPRQSSYIRMDGWDEAAEQWFENQAEKAAG